MSWWYRTLLRPVLFTQDSERIHDRTLRALASASRHQGACTPLAEAARDYVSSLRALWRLADFFVVNVSSPNTPNLRQLQDKSALDEILAALQQLNGTMAQASPTPRPAKPILVKVGPDLSF